MIVFDIETTGLDPDNHLILEVAAIAVDDDLVRKVQPYHAVIGWDILPEVSDTVQEMHTKNGLWRAVADANKPLPEVDQELANYALAHEGQRAILVGRSIHFDRKFVAAHLPLFERTLHYRMVDVSALLLLCDRWHTTLRNQKARGHRALDDADVALQQLRFIKHHLFDGPRRVNELIGRVDTKRLGHLGRHGASGDDLAWFNHTLDMIEEAKRR